MKRWNGWGDTSKTYPLPASAARYLAAIIGEGHPALDAPLEEVLSSIPPSRLPTHPLISTDARERLHHARGQSLPDWIALRSGCIGTFPDEVAYPGSREQVQALIHFAAEQQISLIPYGGGSSVVGHINPLADDRPVLTVDMTCMNRLINLDRTSRLATFEAGICGPDLEGKLRPEGFTFGHFPQSFEFSTLGGWIAARSSGQQSYYYGRIEDNFRGGHVETPAGSLELPVFPASAAGPDLKQIVLGSEGRFGIITEATVRVAPQPETEAFLAVMFPGWSNGVEAVRQIVQAGTPVSMLRLSDPQETEANFALAGRERLVRLADRALSRMGHGRERCLLIYGVTGDKRVTGQARRQLAAIARAHGGLPIDFLIGRMWQKNRFFAPYLRNTLWARGYTVDTLETAAPWSKIDRVAETVKAVLRDGLKDVGERVLVFAHLSHLYPDGASIYVTYLYRCAADPVETLRRWQVLKAAASQTIVAHGGTISHQHGVGVDHAPYLALEKGTLGMAMLEEARRAVDPLGLMNPGKLFTQ